MSNFKNKKKPKKKILTVCLAGNPNSGKTTIFNNLTGSKQKVGNYPGVTVEKKEGNIEYGDYKIKIVDLPGTYSLTAYSIEEIVSRDFIIEEKPDVVVDIVDSSNLERSLYLGVQLKELNVPLVIALNMSDEVKKIGHKHDEKLMSELFGALFVKTIGSKKIGMNELLDAIIFVSENNNKTNKALLHFDYEVENEIEKIIKSIHNIDAIKTKYCSRWLTVKLLENDQNIFKKISLIKNEETTKLLDQVKKSREHILKVFGDEPEIVIADGRYGLINGILKESVILSENEKLRTTDKIDKIILNRLLGLPIFALIMFIVFYLTVDISEPVIQFLEGLFSSLKKTIKTKMPDGALRDLISDGIIGGLGGVLVFVPQILILFFCIAILEATGYMARAAFVIDRIMHKVGLHGKSFVPMLIGFGCSVPAVMATRSLDNEKDRKTTMLALTFMSCGAKFPVYILLIGSLFAKRYSSLLIFTIYVIGILIGIITAKLMKKYVFKGPTTPFVMELPPYRVPTFRGVYHQMWEKLWSYLKKAGTILLAVSIVFWFLLNYPKLNDSEKAVFKTKIDSINYEFNKQISTIAQKVKKSYFDKQNSVSSEAELTDNQKILFKSILFKQTFEKLNKIYKNFNDKILKERTDDHNVRYNTLISERDKLIKEIENKSEEIFLIANQYRILLEYKKVRIKEIESEKISYEKNKSYAGRIGNFITPVFKPMGLDDWRISLSLIAGLAAKEVVVATLGVVYGVEEEEDEETLSLRRKIQEDPFFQRKSPVKSSLVVKRGDKYFLKADNETPVTQRDGAFYLPDSLKAFVLMIFVLLYVPCLATIAIFIKEGGGKLTILMISYNLVIAYTVCTIIYQFGRLFGL